MTYSPFTRHRLQPGCRDRLEDALDLVMPLASRFGQAQANPACLCRFWRSRLKQSPLWQIARTDLFLTWAPFSARHPTIVYYTDGGGTLQGAQCLMFADATSQRIVKERRPPRGCRLWVSRYRAISRQRRTMSASLRKRPSSIPGQTDATSGPRAHCRKRVRFPVWLPP